MRSSLALLLATLVAAPALGAQVVRGKLFQAGSDQPLADAARDALADLPIAELAVSERTLSVLSFRALPKSTGATVLASEIGGVPFVDARAVTLRDVFGNLLTNLIEVSDGAVEGELVEVRDV